MKNYDLVEVQPRLNFDFGMLEHIPGADAILLTLRGYLDRFNGISLHEDDYSLDVRDIIAGDSDSCTLFVTRHIDSALLSARAVLWSDSPSQKELFYSLRQVYDEFRNWKFEASMDESSPINISGFMNPVKEMANLYSSIENVDMTSDLFYGYFKEKIVEMTFYNLHAAFGKPLEMFNSMYDGVIRGAVFTVQRLPDRNMCGVTIMMEKDESV